MLLKLLINYYIKRIHICEDKYEKKTQTDIEKCQICQHCHICVITEKTRMCLNPNRVHGSLPLSFGEPPSQ